jgi:3-deoxy-7-phosphoheptulonate synthase
LALLHSRSGRSDGLCPPPAGVKAKASAQLEIVMRTYFEKPRTVVGWKGLISDPDLNGSYRVNHGIELARKLLLAGQ